MYTGITSNLFLITDVQNSTGMVTYRVKFDEESLKGLELGASVSIDGVCQTVAEINDREVVFNAMEETCKKTTLSHLKVGQKVSIERSACYGAEMGGHPMFGHVYGTADVIDRDETENNLKLVFKCSPDVMEYIFNKGFVGINGSSLTVNDVDLGKNTFAVNLIPHTLKKTDFSNKNIGDKVNIELDANTVTIVDTIKRLNLPEQLLEKKNR